MKKLRYLLSSLALAGMYVQQSNAQVSLPWVEDFEATSTSAQDWDLTNPVSPSDIIVAIDNQQSGYGEGERSLMYNFYSPMFFTQFDAKTPIINNPDRSGLKVSFDFAAAVRYTMPAALQGDFAVDFLYLFASKDSGATWNLIDTFRIDTTGILNTYGCYGAPFICGASPNMHFIPNDTQWTTITDVKLPRGTNRINFMGVRTNLQESNWAYMDNVRIDTCYTEKPTGDTLQYDASYTTVLDLQVSGTGLTWYSDAAGMNEIPTSTVLVNETYYYVTQTVNGCESAPKAIFFKAPTNIKANAGVFKDAKIYPNPANESIMIDAAIPIQNISILDITGKTVMQLKQNTKRIEISSLKAGTYFLTLRNGYATGTFKFTKF